jgi:hypothetical protein
LPAGPLNAPRKSGYVRGPLHAGRPNIWIRELRTPHYILYVSQMPASPPRFGAQARMHGLITQLAQRHDLTAAMLVDDEFDADECRRAMQAYCREVVLIPNPYGRGGLTKRLLQLRSLVSTRSFERLRVTAPTLQRALDRVLRARRFDIVNLEFPYLGHYDLRQASPPASGSRRWSWTHTR